MDPRDVDHQILRRTTPAHKLAVMRGLIRQALPTKLRISGDSVDWQELEPWIGALELHEEMERARSHEA